MTSLADTIDEYLRQPVVSLDDPVDAITGISASTAQDYADPAAVPESYFGTDAVVETVGDLLCSTGTIEAVPHQYRSEARHDLLSARVDGDDGTVADLLVSSDTDAEACSRTDIDFQRFTTAAGALHTLHGRAAIPPTLAAIREDDARAGSPVEPVQVARAGHDNAGDADTFVPATSVSDRLEMHDWDVVLLTTADSVGSLEDPAVRQAATTTRVAAETLTLASLLVRRNLARDPACVSILAGDDARPAEFVPEAVDGGVTMRVAPPDRRYVLTAATRGPNDDTAVGRLVEEQVS